MEDLIKIPYPNFKYTEYIERKANEFCLLNIRKGISSNPKGDIEKIRDKLYDILRIEDKIQFISHLINHITVELDKHIKTCKNTYCQAESMTQDVLYYLYNELEDNGLETDKESFSKEQISMNNEIVDEIIYSLKELKAGQDIIFTEIDARLIDTTIEELEYSKGLQIIGKSKWLKYIGGIVLEFAANKVLEAFFKNTFMPSIAKFKDAARFFIN